MMNVSMKNRHLLLIAFYLDMHNLQYSIVCIVAAAAATVKPENNGLSQLPAAKKKEKVAVRKKDGKAVFVHSWLACNLKGHSGPVLGLDFSPNGKYLASCSEGSSVHIIIIIIIQHLYSAIMSYADTEALVAPVKSE